MKKFCGLLVLVTVVSQTAALMGSSLTEIKGLGKDREHLTPELIASRSDLLQTNLNFYLLRFPDASRAPARIFEPQLWAIIERAARENDLDPMLLAGMIFIESYGDPLAKSPTGPAGIAQLTKASAKEMGLSTSRKTQVGSRTVTKTRTVGKGKDRHKVVETHEEPIFQKIDERFDPERAVAAMARRVRNRRAWLGGKLDFAVAEYHMGAGRMTKLLSAYFGRKIRVGDIPTAMRAASLSYPELFWTNTPYYHPEVYKEIETLNRVDFSPTYYFRVQQAMRLLSLYRKSASDYATLAYSFQGGFGRQVLPDWQWSFVSEQDAASLALQNRREVDAAIGQRIVTLPGVASLFGVRAQRTADGDIAAERSTIGCLLFVARQLEQLQGKKFKGIETNTMVRPLSGESSPADARKPLSADTDLPMHSLGWAFDLPRKGLSKDQVRDLNFILTDLRFAGLLAVNDEGKKQAAFHVVRNPADASRFEQFYWDAVAVPLAASAAAAYPR